MNKYNVSVQKKGNYEDVVTIRLSIIRILFFRKVLDDAKINLHKI